MRSLGERGLLPASVALVAALLLVGASLARAMRTDVPAAAPAGTATAAVPEVSFAPTAPELSAADDPADPSRIGEPAKPFGMDALTLAAENDPFQHDRKRPGERYVLPGERVTYEPPPEPAPPPPFRVIGTALSPSGGLAVIQVEEMTPRVIALGEAMAGYTLESVDGESATLVGEGRTLTLPVTAAPDPQPQRARPGARDRGNAQFDGRARDARERQVDILEAIRRQMIERGGVPQDIQLENGRVIVRPRVNRDTLDMR